MDILFFLLLCFDKDTTFITDLRQQLIIHEGYIPYVYKDPLDNLTYGVGHLVKDSLPYKTPIPLIQIEYTLLDDIRKAIHDTKSIIYKSTWDAMTQTQRMALVDFVFNVGIDNAKGFTKTIALLNQQRWAEASIEILKSKWRKQVGKRAYYISSKLKQK